MVPDDQGGLVVARELAAHQGQFLVEDEHAEGDEREDAELPAARGDRLHGLAGRHVVARTRVVQGPPSHPVPQELEILADALLVDVSRRALTGLRDVHLLGDVAPVIDEDPVDEVRVLQDLDGRAREDVFARVQEGGQEARQFAPLGTDARLEFLHRTFVRVDEVGEGDVGGDRHQPVRAPGLRAEQSPLGQLTDGLVDAAQCQAEGLGGLGARPARVSDGVPVHLE